MVAVVMHQLLGRSLYAWSAQDTVVCTGVEATTIPTKRIVRALQTTFAARSAGEVSEGRGDVATTLRHAPSVYSHSAFLLLHVT